MGVPYSIPLLASAARTATVTREFSGLGARGIQVYIKSTAIADSPSVVFTIDAFDAGSGAWYNLLTSLAVTDGATARRLIIHPDATASANLIAKDFVVDRMRLVATHNDSDSITYSAGLTLLP